MSENTAVASPEGLPGVVVDWASEKQAFSVPWGKAMMWIFLLSDTFIFSCFLTGYMHVRYSTTAPWPNPNACLCRRFRAVAAAAGPEARAHPAPGRTLQPCLRFGMLA